MGGGVTECVRVCVYVCGEMMNRYPLYHHLALVRHRRKRGDVYAQGLDSGRVDCKRKTVFGDWRGRVDKVDE